MAYRKLTGLVDMKVRDHGKDSLSGTNSNGNAGIKI